MDKEDKKKFITNFVDSVRDDILKKIEEGVPEEWDGHELRAWCYAAFLHEAKGGVIFKEARFKRARDFWRKYHSLGL